MNVLCVGLKRYACAMNIPASLCRKIIVNPSNDCSVPSQTYLFCRTSTDGMKNPS